MVPGFGFARSFPDYLARWLKEQQQQLLIGYRVSRRIDVRVLDLEQLGGILEALTETGVNRAYARLCTIAN